MSEGAESAPVRLCLSDDALCTGIKPCDACLGMLNGAVLSPSLSKAWEEGSSVIAAFNAAPNATFDWQKLQVVLTDAFFRSWVESLVALEKSLNEAAETMLAMVKAAQTLPAEESSSALPETVSVTAPDEKETGETGTKKRKSKATKKTTIQGATSEASKPAHEER